MPHNNGRIYTETVNGVRYGVSTDDVASVLGLASSDVATLCRAGNINPWARYKPVYIAKANASPGPLTDDTRRIYGWGCKTRYAYTQAQVNTIEDFAHYIMGRNETPYLTRAEIRSMVSKGFVELLPIPVECWYRLADFVKVTDSGVVDNTGYRHGATPQASAVIFGTETSAMASPVFSSGHRSLTIAEGRQTRMVLPDDKAFLSRLAAVIQGVDGAGQFVTDSEQLSPVEIIAGQNGYQALFADFNPQNPNAGANAVRGIMLFREDTDNDTYRLVAWQRRNNYTRNSTTGSLTDLNDDCYYTRLTFTQNNGYCTVAGSIIERLKNGQTRTVTDAIIESIARHIVYGTSISAAAQTVLTGGSGSVPYYGGSVPAAQRGQFLKKVITIIYGAVISPNSKYLDLTYRGLIRTNDAGLYGGSYGGDNSGAGQIFRPDGTNYLYDEPDAIDGTLLAVEYYQLLYPPSTAPANARAIIPGYAYFVDIRRVASDYVDGLDYVDMTLTVDASSDSTGVLVIASVVTGGRGWSDIVNERYATLTMAIYSGTTVQRTINLLGVTPSDEIVQNDGVYAVIALNPALISYDSVVLSGRKTGDSIVYNKTFSL